MDEAPFAGWYSGDNARLFKLLSVYLNLDPAYVTADMIAGIAGSSPTKEQTEFAFASLVAAACGLDVYGSAADRRFFGDRFLPCFSLLDTAPYVSDPFYSALGMPEGRMGRWSFEKRVCRPYEAFVYSDPVTVRDGSAFRVTPRIGFFAEPYPYPAVLENGREWMTLMPNETNTTAPALGAAHGDVLTFGLGLGYFACSALMRPQVRSVTVVERSSEVAELFSQFVLPKFGSSDRLTVVCADAFEYAERNYAPGRFDFVFADIWHDPSDGVGLWRRFKALERLMPGADYSYWLEDTLKLYL